MKYLWYIEYSLAFICPVFFAGWIFWLVSKRNEWSSLITIRFISYISVIALIAFLYNILCNPIIWDGVFSGNLNNPYLLVFFLTWLWLGCIWIWFESLLIYLMARRAEESGCPDSLFKNLYLISASSIIPWILSIPIIVFLGHWIFYDIVILVFGGVIMSLILSLIVCQMLEPVISIHYKHTFDYVNVGRRFSFTTWGLVVATMLCVVGVLLGNLSINSPEKMIYKIAITISLVTVPFVYLIHAFTCLFEQTVSALSESEERFRDISYSIADWIWEIDEKGMYTYCSHKLSEILGYQTEEFVGKTIFDFMLPEERIKTEKVFQKKVNKKESVEDHESWMVNKDEREICISINANPILDKDGYLKGFRGAGKDITDRKRMVDELKRSATILNTMIDAVTIVDLDGNVIECNKALIDKFGYSKDEIIGKNTLDIAISDKEKIKFQRELDKLLSGEAIEATEYQLLHKDGREIPVSINLSLIYDLDDKINGIVAVVRDITEQKQWEAKLEYMNRRLIDYSRQAGMEEVATSVLHNVGNVLNSVNVSATLVKDMLMYSETLGLSQAIAMIQDHVEDLNQFITHDKRGKHLLPYLIELSKKLKNDEEEMLREINLLTKNIEHIKDIINIQQSYTRMSGVLEPVSIKELLEDVLQMNSAAFERHNVRVERKYVEVPEVVTDKHKVLQILINLIRNAKYALDDVQNRDKLLTVQLGLIDKNYICINVIDNGVGIHQANMKRLFSYGFTTRKDGHGFGLFSGFRAAKELGGSLTASSEGPYKGATFTLELPIKNGQTHQSLM